MGIAAIVPNTLTMRRRLVRIDLEQLVPAVDPAARGAAAGIKIAQRGLLTLNLFEAAACPWPGPTTACAISCGSVSRMSWRAAPR